MGEYILEMKGIIEGVSRRQGAGRCDVQRQARRDPRARRRERRGQVDAHEDIERRLSRRHLHGHYSHRRHREAFRTIRKPAKRQASPSSTRSSRSSKQLRIVENICLGDEVAKFGVINWDQSIPEGREGTEAGRPECQPIVSRIVSWASESSSWSPSRKALSKKARILVLDEPTAALSEGESAKTLAYPEGAHATRASPASISRIVSKRSST